MEIVNIKRSLLLIPAMLLAFTLFSQEKAAVDRINTSAGPAEIHLIGHGTLMISINGFIIHIDPVKSSGSYAGLPKADLILVTHEHGDHLDIPLISELKKENTVMLCNEKSASSVPWAKIVKPGDKEKVGSVTVETVFAYNIKNVRPDGQAYHPRGNGNGYVITIGDKRIYIAGDTENTPEMKALKNIDVAFLPMNLPFTMTPEMVADAARAFKPAILYPYHFGNTNTSELVELLKDSGIEVRIRNLK
jgi:L-ascorbate metabolism protein UlaG (beta-lactamase superfamily)